MRKAVTHAIYSSPTWHAYREASRKIHEAARAFREAQRELDKAVAALPYLTSAERKTIERTIDNTDPSRWDVVDQHSLRDVTQAAVERAIDVTLDPTREQAYPARVTVDLWNGSRSFDLDAATDLADVRTDFPIASRRTG